MLLNKIPYSYLWIHRKAIGDDVKTILDLGCGDGSFMEALMDNNWQVTGVDINKDSVKKARKRDIYKEVLIGDVLEVAESFKEKKRRFDVVFCSQVLEHIAKEKGKELIEIVEDLAASRVVIGTPRGFMEQPENHEDGNDYQEHLSGWEEDELRNLGYKVHGVGLNIAWSYSGLARTSNKLISILFKAISFIFSPVVFYFPQLGSGLVAYKNL